MPDRFLSVRDASVLYGPPEARTPALRDVNVDFPEGRLTLVMGPSGCGKTTLLSLLGCLLIPDRGSVYVIGEDVTRMSEAERTRIRQQHIGFIFQAFRLFRSLSVLDNVTIAREISGGRNGRDLARQLLWQFGLEHKAGLKPDQLSGGEKQRVAIARALVKGPSILLADEPTASLDSRSGNQIAEILSSLAQDEERTVVVVSHDPRWAEFAHCVVAMRDGEIVQDGD